MAAGDKDGVVADRVGVEVHDLGVDDQAAGEAVPGGCVHADPGDGPEMLGQRADQRGQLGLDVARAGPPRAVQEPLQDLVISSRSSAGLIAWWIASGRSIGSL